MSLFDLETEEVGSEQEVEQQQQRQSGQRPDQRAPPMNLFFLITVVAHGRCPAMVCMITCSSISLPASSPTLTRSRSTTTRWQPRTTSSSSELMNRIAIPFSRSD